MTQLTTKELIHPGILIKYHEDRPPSKAVKSGVIAACGDARKVMRAAVWKLDKVSLFGADEGRYLPAILNTHFHMGDANETKKDRRRRLVHIREGMLSVSVGLHDHYYLLDVDTLDRPDPDDPTVGFTNTKGYVSRHGPSIPAVSPLSKTAIMADANRQRTRATAYGPIHIDFKLFEKGCQPFGFAMTIIHEAAHRYLKVLDHAYAHATVRYAGLTMEEALDNADSWAYVAMSIYAKKTLDLAEMNRYCAGATSNILAQIPTPPNP